MNGATRRARPIASRHRGTIYLLVLSATLLVALLGISALLVARVEHRAMVADDDMAKARSYAQSGMELALLLVNDDPGWRTTLGNTNWPTNQPIGDGTFTIKVLDELDGAVSAGVNDPLIVTAIGRKGQAAQKIQVKLVPDDPTTPMEALGYGLHAGAGIVVGSGRDAWADHGKPIMTNTTVVNDGTIHGDVEAGSTIINNGTITGTATSPVPVKDLPESWVFDMYKAIATPIPSPGTIDKEVLAPGRNPWGPPNANGVYFIDAGSGDLTIRDSRIHGTLVVKCDGVGHVRLENAVLLHPYHRRFPALIVDGEVEMRFTSDVTTLDESDLGTNFNPPGAPYRGGDDTDENDSYSNEIQGLVHITGQLFMEQTAEVDGIVICESTATLDGDNEFNWDGELQLNPPLGYTTTGAGSPMVIVPGSWKHIVD